MSTFRDGVLQYKACNAISDHQLVTMINVYRQAMQVTANNREYAVFNEHFGRMHYELATMYWARTTVRMFPFGRRRI